MLPLFLMASVVPLKRSAYINCACTRCTPLHLEATSFVALFLALGERREVEVRTSLEDLTHHSRNDDSIATYRIHHLCLQRYPYSCGDMSRSVSSVPVVV
jgi:hypothetical protein